MNKNNLEIERRWLLSKSPHYLDNCDYQAYVISQWYTPTGRFRYMRLRSDSDDNAKYYHTVKTAISHGVSKEIEKEITYDEFKKVIHTATRSLSKTRYILTENNLTYEIDYIRTNGEYYIILEIELDDIDQEIHIPTFISNFIVREITGDKSLSNYNLATIL